jgi:ABC-type multidrug transport system ATPase subunit
MQIQLEQIGKKYNREWIFRGLSFTFSPEKKYAITGPNGSGKSTLLQTIAGSTALSEGTVNWLSNNTVIAPENHYQHLGICTPSLSLIEEMTAVEFLAFHESFKSFIPGNTPSTILETIGLSAAANKQIRYYSSGMKQRLKLAQAIFSDVPVLFLDEPCTNLDESGFALYKSLIKDYATHKLIIVSSNDKAEYDFCEEVIDIKKYK